MRVLVACEFSGRVRDAFLARGHDAWSCDIEPTEVPGPHIQADIFSVIENGWDLVVAHPPCKYLCSMGIWWNHKRPARWPLTDSAFDFVRDIWSSSVPRLCIENPVGYLNSNWQKPSQIINPWMFGDPFTKPTCLWLRGLPTLVPTDIVSKGDFYIKKNGRRMSKWSHRFSSSRPVERAKNASRTFPGIALAMASQWG